MKEGDVILVALPQADGKTKNRPAIILRITPPFGDLMVCGITTQLRHAVKNLDEIISPNDEDFKASGLLEESLIRLGYIFVLPRTKMAGVLGEISISRHTRLLKSLAAFLTQKST